MEPSQWMSQFITVCYIPSTLRRDVICERPNMIVRDILELRLLNNLQITIFLDEQFHSPMYLHVSNIYSQSLAPNSWPNMFYCIKPEWLDLSKQHHLKFYTVKQHQYKYFKFKAILNHLVLTFLYKFY